MVDVDVMISQVKKEIAAKQTFLAGLEEFRASQGGRAENHASGTSDTPTRDAVFSPAGALSGREAAKKFLQQFHEPQPVARIYQGATQMGAKVARQSLASILHNEAKKGKTFKKGRKTGYYGLLEWDKVTD